MNCLNCGQLFENKRKDAKFCTNKCRIYYSRKIKPKDEIVTAKCISVTAKQSVTDIKAVTDKIVTARVTDRQPIPRTLVVNKKVKKYMGVFGICPKHHGSNYFTCGCTPPAKE